MRTTQRGIQNHQTIHIKHHHELSLFLLTLLFLLVSKVPVPKSNRTPPAMQNILVAPNLHR